MRQPFTPTDEQRAAVRAARADGAGQADIATRLGISLPTLRKYFRAELGAQPAPAPPAGLALFDAPIAPSVPAPSPPRPVGRPSYVPTPWDRDRVEVWVASGMKQREIALALGVSEPTLREAFSLEIETGAAKRKAEAVTLLHKAAKSGNISAIREWNARIDEAELARLGGVVAPAAKRVEDTPGKKAAALSDAHGVLTGEGRWASLLGDTQGTA